MDFRCFVLTLVLALCLKVPLVYSQINTPTNTPINTPCSASMITSFTPCLNFLTNSTANGASTPTSGCCNSLKDLTSRSMDCLCLLVTGSVPFQIPINRTLAISLQRICRMSGVPVQCKGPATLDIAPSPGSTSTVPEASSPNTTPESNTTPALSPPLAPESDTMPTLTPPSTGVDSGVPTTDADSPPTLTPSSVASTYVNSPFVIVASGVTFIWYFLF
ncbi:non-specific lipid transfer protein GPI-anchored 20-like isoform X2 [Bidens hawaiensis]|uniref:non-specific lipid transfer protein GPI-anchored 20-like isoform X2 n=1 Tax=Bidens hawaiensis TaxID=980011 RepID=UPI00404B5F18